jgi:hypothetical protein
MITLIMIGFGILSILATTAGDRVIVPSHSSRKDPK